ncbi:PLP-dependent aminotransferase family protein [Bacillus alkalicellulosilyticus]|uniref:aminotransferase-like domain-containing protein n=1 Tax=Alkalihalobacterium alkalicellulosilyticum TaxID=1912214 RepID=UPI0009980C62|nr:PLP-dependent aminotransferase family protein [Bacillus alkalicellulosilyticus]
MKPINWKPNKFSSIPLHKQITNFIKEKIARGEWTVGYKLPPQRLFAKSIGVNRSTLVTALDELTAEGLIEGKSGSGTKVINNTWSLLSATPPPDWNSYVKSGTYFPNLPTIQDINRAEFVPEVIRLGTGELAPDLVNNDLMLQVLKCLPKKEISLGYEEPKGLLALRKQISHYVKTLGIDASPSSILIVSGALQAIQLISMGLLHSGSTVLTEKPSYLHSINTFQSAGMQLTGVPLDAEGIDPSLVALYRKQHNAALLYTNPTFQNPTGNIMTSNRRKQLLTLCSKEQLPLIEDDVYRELWIDRKPPLPLKSMDDNGMVLYLGSLSKTLSPGIRIGWVIGPEQVIDRLADIKMQTDYGSSSLSQWLAVEWFSSGLYQLHLQNIRKQLKERRDFTLNILNSYFSDIAEWETPGGGFYIWLRLLQEISIKELFDTALQKQLLINPGNIYDNKSDQYIRISYSYASLSHMEKGLFELSNIIRELSEIRN